jgi:hypothetical protein
MKKTTTRRTEHWAKCCDNPECRLCCGTGKYLSSIIVETATEEYDRPWPSEAEVVEAEEVAPQLEDEKVSSNS